jgi:acetoin utilization deacetylase AcuC-like enzyme
VNLFYSDVFVLPLPPHHRFPMGKYVRLRERLLASGDFAPDDFGVPAAASDAEICRVHCGRYLEKVATGALSAAEQKAIGFPWSERMVERSRRSSGATLAAAREALTRGWGANLAGGTHHAFRDRGEGFCVFNDAAITARALQAEAGLQRIAIIDCDVHQGNGTASIFAADESVFTFSIHGARNFPFAKEASDLDVELADGTGDDEYLWHLERALDETLERSRPQLAIEHAGAAP